MNDVVKEIARKTRAKDQPALFDVPTVYMDEWWGMPSFEMGDATPQQSIKVNFQTWDDAVEFAKRLEIDITPKTDSMWFPKQDTTAPSTVVYDGGSLCPKYPIFIPSKGRYETPHTANRLKEMDCPFYIVVEPSEANHYRRAVGDHHVLVLPFEDLGQGSIPARNWIWDRAIEMGSKRHWIIDDNIVRFYRLNHNRRIPVKTATIFRCIEDFTDRYENIAFSGLNNIAFASDRSPSIQPFTLNTRIYSMTLINNDLPYRWRGKYNEDTDICLRALKDGWVTIQFNAFLGDKSTTMKMKGGNTDTIYDTGDHRREFAESLRRQHPDIVKVVWKFGRWHHEVDYSQFRNNRLKKREDITPIGQVDEYDMVLRRR